MKPDAADSGSPKDDCSKLHLFNEAEVLAPEEEAKPIEVPAHTRQKPKRKPLPADFPKVDEIHVIPEEQKVCGCGASLKCIVQKHLRKPTKRRAVRNTCISFQ